MKNNVITLILGLKYSCLAREDKIMNELKLSPAEYRGIISLIPGSETPCSILSKKMGLSVSRGSRVIAKLIKNGYLKETYSKTDQRVTKVSLTPKGIKTYRRIQNIFEECEQAILKFMPRQELEMFSSSLSRISGILVSK